MAGQERNSLEDYLQFAKNTALKAGEIAVKLRSSAFIEQNKDGLHNYATNADIQVENFITSEIKKNFPGHAIMAEESKAHITDSPYRWVIDPIDGTWQYKTGQPNYAILVALEYESIPAVSVACFPHYGDLFESSAKTGTLLNGKKVRVSTTADLAGSFVYINHPSFKTPPDVVDWNFNLLKALTLKTYRTFPSHSSSIDLFWVAQGACDGLVSNLTRGGWWDRAAGIAALLNAGGKVTTFDKKPVTSENYTKGYIASNGKIHQLLINLVKSIT